MHTQESQESSINDKVQSSYVQCTQNKMKEQILIQLLAKHDVQSNKMEHNVNMKKKTHNSIYIDIYN